ncbi:galactose oxidase [Gymnopus androsaceus JB14]|uniref:Galactose oxidase n=1 Tax=Gymnopus androsaceus JB14 TaxID=1447944 RepID=A0A6A4I6J9_9AGAR|nr:galactose oxidase [Gymnopus androsaceus JB14]
MVLKAQWHRIAGAAIPRSSHTLSVISRRGYIFGGEIVPREPVDNAMHVVALPFSTSYPKYSQLDARPDAGTEVPQARVGHSAAVIDRKIFVFGGRGGADMQPLEENGRLWVYDTRVDAWSFLDPVPGPVPSSRSYHTSLAIDKPATVFIHAGCPRSGRLNDLWAFDVASRTWKELPEAPGKPRGGTSLGISKDRIVYRFGGFNGQAEEGRQIDYLQLSLVEEARIAAKGSWDSLVFADEDTKRPGNRSVAGMHAVTSGDGREYLIAFLGERDPSSQGHAGAGKFWSDVWSFPLPVTAESKWEEVVVAEGADGVPGERGWFSSCMSDDGEIVLWGGLDGMNQRLDNGWVLKL